MLGNLQQTAYLQNAEIHVSLRMSCILVRLWGEGEVQAAPPASSCHLEELTINIDLICQI